MQTFSFTIYNACLSSKHSFLRRKLLQQSKPDSRVAYNGFGWGQRHYIKDKMKLENCIKIRKELLQQTLNQ